MKTIHLMFVMMTVLVAPGLSPAAGFKWTCATLYKNGKLKPISSKDECYRKGLLEMSRLGCSQKQLPNETPCSSSGIGSQSLISYWRCEIPSICNARVLDFTPTSDGKPQSKVDCSQTQAPVDYGDIYELQKVTEEQICIQKKPTSPTSPAGTPASQPASGSAI
jgi:hypothetical protein